MFNMILSLITGTFTSWFASKQEVAVIKAKNKAQSVVTHLAGWSDEFLILVWSYPFTSMFVPVLRPHTVKAFESLNLLPDWYVGGFISITFAVFGIDKVFKWRGNR